MQTVILIGLGISLLLNIVMAGFMVFMQYQILHMQNMVRMTNQKPQHTCGKHNGGN